MVQELWTKLDITSSVTENPSQALGLAMLVQISGKKIEDQLQRSKITLQVDQPEGWDKVLQEDWPLVQQ